MTFGVTDDSAASYYLAPQLALKVAAQEKRALFIFDDALLHQTIERSIYDLADQPFSPINIFNNISDLTGTFKKS
jgi:hypothetical protein